MNRCSKTILTKTVSHLSFRRIVSPVVMPAPDARFSHTITITQASWNARKVWEAVCSPGSLSLRVGTTYQLPPDPLKIYHMASRAPLLLFNQILCFGKEFVIWAIRVFSLNFFSSKATSSQKLPFLFPSPLFLSLSGDLVKVAPPPNHSSPAFPQVPPLPSAPLYFPKFAFFTFTFFLRLLFCCQSTNSASI